LQVSTSTSTQAGRASLSSLFPQPTANVAKSSNTQTPGALAKTAEIRDEEKQRGIEAAFIGLAFLESSC
jgi:hypothetical protein